MSPNLLSFCLAATYNILPSPSNLLRWHLSEESSCFLCKKEHCTLAHILGACKISLQQGHFTYRHDSVLSKLIDSLKAFMNSIPNKGTQNKKICFVKSGTPPPKRSTNKSGILYSTNDWKVVTDCNKQYVFPIQIALTALCPDILIYSPSLRHVIIIELTCPCEENMERWHSVKFNKYEPLMHTIKNNCWAMDLFAVEVGA